MRGEVRGRGQVKFYINVTSFSLYSVDELKDKIKQTIDREIQRSAVSNQGRVFPAKMK